MTNSNILLDGGPVRDANKLQFGDRIQLQERFSRKPWRVTYVGDFIQITDIEYSLSDEYKSLSFEELNEMDWVHYGHDTPLWKRILTFGAWQLEKF